jgi:glycosyltransferase involved in cell wall biosynthesis
MVEAMACGLPIVSTDCVSGPSEILEGGRYGRLVPPGDQDGFARALEEALTDPGDPATRVSRANAFSASAAADAYLRASRAG